MRPEKDTDVEGRPTLRELDWNAAWRGDELPQREDWEPRLNETEVGELVRAAGQLSEQVSDQEASGQIAPLMPHVARRLQQIQFNLEKRSVATMTRDFPLERIEPLAAERLFVAAMSRIGTPVPQTVDGAK